MNPGFESVGISFAVYSFLTSKRSELMDGGAMDGLIAWEAHVRRVDV